ncbi:hypothetical protein [Mesorhizobium sp. IMUNJ 23232]|uniref:hypothetical protein n=1 Tax=Mesorhizobium sp. IMUNJ 23232 TaxID=3376064 RepID=UPI003788F530
MNARVVAAISIVMVTTLHVATRTVCQYVHTVNFAANQTGMAMQRAEVNVAGQPMQVKVTRLGAGLWAVSGDFADREIVVVDRSPDAALDRWRATAADDWRAAA